MSRRMNGLIAFLMMFFLMLLVVPVFASPDIDIKNELIGGDNTASNIATNSISGSRSYGFGMGDVDINDYYRSHQALFLQWTTPNLLSLAIYYDATGRYEAAAILKCSVKQVRKSLGKDCQSLSTVDPKDLVPRKQATKKPDTDEDDDERYDALYARITGLEAKRVQDKATAEKVAKRANARVVRAERLAVSQYGITDEQRQELAEVFKQ